MRNGHYADIYVVVNQLFSMDDAKFNDFLAEMENIAKGIGDLSVANSVGRDPTSTRLTIRSGIGHGVKKQV